MNHRPLLVVLMLCAGLLPGCGRKKKVAAPAPPQVTLATVKRDSVPLRMEFVGQTEGILTVVIQPRVNGFLAAKNFRRGMPVRKGQLLYEIDPPEFEANVNSARASLAAAEAQLQQAGNDYNRAVPLAAINAISQSMLDQYHAGFVSAQAARKVALANLTNMRLSLGYTKIYAPIDGVIGEKDPEVGEYVGVGTNYAVLNTISNIDSVLVGVALPVARYLEVVRYIRDRQERVDPSYANRRLLSDIRLTLSDGSAYPWEGHYRYTAQSVGDALGTLTLTVTFPNPEKLLKAGEYARVTASVGPLREALLVPQQAVSQSQGVNSLWVMKADSTAEFRKITLERSYGNQWLVSDGVKEGEQVLTSGQLKVRQGVKLRVAPARMLPDSTTVK